MISPFSLALLASSLISHAAAFKAFPGSVHDNAGVVAPASGLSYGGGPVLPNVEIFPVYFGADTLFQAQTTTFYDGIAKSSLMDMMAQYSTSTQKIGRGSVVGSYVVTDNTKKSITESDITAYLKKLVANGTIRPNANTYVPFHLPPSVSISGQCSTFCAFHNSVSTSAGQVAYGVIPDQSGACKGCGGAGGQGDAFRAVTDSASHELAEAVTDPQPTSGWNGSGGEIGDLCNPTSGFVTGPDGVSWYIQGEWSNALNACWLGDSSNPGTKTTTTTTKGSTTTTTTTVVKTTGAASSTTTTTTKVPVTSAATTKTTTTTTTKVVTTTTTKAAGGNSAGAPCTTYGAWACSNSLICSYGNSGLVWVQVGGTSSC
ncbi:UNVERIFIED_CONTAM: hypothetical protein HDU68_005071 [Siphonaria sp. JEL0065]|nr:hypothetical protein HDU68_005071 [Siphonaria sp. JEL0065]